METVTMSKDGFKIHPAAMAFPRITGDEFTELKTSIKERGIEVPILLNKQGQVLDGRNRIAAAHDLGLSKIPVEHFKGKPEDEVFTIVSRNILRRHLTDDQRVTLAAKLLGKKIEKEAINDRLTARKKGAVKSGSKGSSPERLAKMTGTTQHKAKGALKVARVAPSLADKVVRGETKLKDARKAVTKKTAKVKPTLTLEARVKKAYLSLMLKFTPSEYKEVREIIRKIVNLTTTELSKK